VTTPDGRDLATGGGGSAGSGGGGSAGSGGGGSAGSGGGGGARDLATATTDMVHPRAGISCGTQQCSASAQYCCTSDKGATGTCNASNNFSCAAVYFFCDGPEDCPPALAECCVVSGSATCVSRGQCTQMSGTLMCHDGNDCGGASSTSCCPAPKSPYALCLGGACP
jgi:hypothetical protein